ncbi:MAG: lipopolysaccharide assembly protein LapA domain-containing protein [Brachybacterium sp.]|uniref:LapA family protein n=1 Tax=Brachybacterium sp. TaxID=1891286 RepID=UPI002649A2BB|nr:lipopolysaccharide assembly protein LapA domain-containing protein [Brachybacterium sp.]MDN5688765.1 lipopolysaccharide assembly protein LapA domain-containing protein [Brachybacterium sp.]
MSTGPETPDRPTDRTSADGTEADGATGRDRAAEAPAGTERPAESARGRRAADAGDPADTGEGPAPRPEKPDPVEPVSSGGGRTAGIWISLILGAIVLVLLLIFVIQNSDTASFEYFGAGFDLPLGVAMLLAAIAGALVMALVGSVRMIQMSWTIRKMRKQQEKIQRAVR